MSDPILMEVVIDDAARPSGDPTFVGRLTEQRDGSYEADFWAVPAYGARIRFWLERDVDPRITEAAAEYRRRRDRAKPVRGRASG